MRIRPKVLSILAAVTLFGTAGTVTATGTTEPPGTEPTGTEAAAATEPAGTPPPTTEYVPPARGEADLVIWADLTRADAIRPLADSFAADEGLVIEVFEVPFDRIRDLLTTAGPAGEGPDIIIGAHDWLGELVSNGSLAPIDLGDSAADYSEVAIQAFTYDGQLYGLPYAVENIALVRNTDLVPEAPATFEDLEETALQLVADGQATIPLAIQEGPADPYHNYPLFSAYGGYVFGQNEDGTFNPDDVGIDSEGGLAAAEAFARWSEEGLISKDVTYDVMIDAFASGDAPFAITGPWAVNDPDRGFVQSGVNFAVEPIPPVAGGTPQVFVGVQGFMISSYSENIDLATTFLVDYVNSEDLQMAMFEAGGRPPAMTSAFEAVADDPVIQGFGLSGQQGIPQPAIPEMAAVWETWRDAYNLIFTGTDPTEAFTNAAESIRTAIAG
jgi:maltose-binding protein MalE